MARDIDLSNPLSKDDIAWLKARYPQSRVDHMVALAGTTAEEAENAPEKEETEEGGQSTAEAPQAPETGGEAEDLIGAPDFDPGKHTVDEVLKHLKEASDEEKARVLKAEADGKQRSGILNS